MQRYPTDAFTRSNEETPWLTVAKAETACTSCDQAIDRGDVLIYRARPRAALCVRCAVEQDVQPVASRAYLRAQREPRRGW